VRLCCFCCYCCCCLSEVCRVEAEVSTSPSTSSEISPTNPLRAPRRAHQINHPPTRHQP
jgi:hypothetical protein